MASRIHTGLALLGLYVLVLVAVEAGLRGLFALRDRAKPPLESRPEPRALLPAYADADYDPVRTWREIEEASDRWLRYEPYTVWSRTDRGSLVRVDPRGRRVTHHNAEAPDALRVWTLGGSTMWGMGVPDAETIPSHLARLLNAWGVDTRVQNLGETGFVSTQEVLALLRELQAGRRTDVVVVYDGANEGLGAAEDPQAVTPHYLLERIRGLFEGRVPEREPAWRRLLHQTALYRLSRSVRARLGLLPEPEAAPAASRAPEAPPDGERGARYLARNHRFVAILAGEYGFVPLFFFQPRPGVGDKPLHASEREILEGLRRDPLQRWILTYTRELRAAFRARLARGELPARTRDIADVFRGVEEPVYIDWVHVTHRGNRRVARRLFEALRHDLCATPPPQASPRIRAQLRAACGTAPEARR